MREYGAYLFDADGTLLDTKGPILAAFEGMGRGLGVELPPREIIAGTIGLPLTRQIRLILGDGYDAGFYDRASAIYGDGLMADYKKTLKLFPGVLTGLRVLKERGKKLAVVTSRRILSLEAFLEVTGIDGYFDLLVTPELTERHKPDAEPALYAARELGVETGECVFIGDAVFDIECGHAAGMDTVLVAWGGNVSDGWKVQPDTIIDDFSALYN